MDWSKSKAFLDFVVSHNVLGFFEEPITLKSGAVSGFYINWRPLTNQVGTLSLLTDFLVDFMTEKGFVPEAIYGVPEGGTKVAIATSIAYGRSLSRTTDGSCDFPVCMGRKQPKSHGNPSDSYFIGAPSGRFLIVEDTITSGGSLLDELERLKAMNLTPCYIIALADRSGLTDGSTRFEAQLQASFPGLQYAYLSRADQLIERTCDRKVLPRSISKELAGLGY